MYTKEDIGKFKENVAEEVSKLKLERKENEDLVPGVD